MVTYLIAICGLGVLMIVHETGHYLAARAFGMRVTKFSLGIAPTLFRFQPKGSPTVFQVGAIPFFAYVQIAGMNPLEESSPDDKSSYVNASLFGRIVTIMAGSLANYITASAFFFAAFWWQGYPMMSDTLASVSPIAGRPAALAGFHEGDRIVEIDHTPVKRVDQVTQLVGSHANQPTSFVIDRRGERVELLVTPLPTGENGSGQIGVGLTAETTYEKVSFSKAASLAIIAPPRFVVGLLRELGKWVLGKQKAEFGGPVKIVEEGARAARSSPFEFLSLLGVLSANLAAFNLLPIPALDGGRLVFLGYEAVSRRRPDAMVEAQIHLVGFLMLLAVMLIVTYKDITGIFIKH